MEVKFAHAQLHNRQQADLAHSARHLPQENEQCHTCSSACRGTAPAAGWAAAAWAPCRQLRVGSIGAYPAVAMPLLGRTMPDE